MKTTIFNHVSELDDRAFDLLREHMGMAVNGPHAVMLTGGRTPLALYDKVGRSPVDVDASLHLLITDERHVPLESPDNNFGHMQPMVTSLGLDESQIMRVHTDATLQECADRYNEELGCFLRGGGRITLGLLGLGTDGHVASLFDAHDVARGKGRYAIAVQRPREPHRVSVTSQLLAATERLVFLVTGAEKTAVVEKIGSNPESVVAYQAVKKASNVELWFAADRPGRE